MKKISLIGISLLMVSNAQAQENISEQFGAVLGIINWIALILAFGGFIFAGFSAMQGRNEQMVAGLIGGALMGLSWVIVKFFFEQGSGEDIDLELDFDGRVAPEAVDTMVASLQPLNNLAFTAEPFLAMI